MTLEPAPCEPTREAFPTVCWIRGGMRALPIVLGYLPIGLAYGVLAQQAGLSPIEVVAMSVFVYAGSAQLIAVGMIAVGLPALSIVATTFVVNLRHVLFSAALVPFLGQWRKPALAAFAYELTDETFALHSVHFSEGVPPRAEVFASNLTAHTAWILGSVAGALVGGWVTDVRLLALDYTLPAMFIGLLLLQLRTRLDAIVAVCSGILAVAFALGGVTGWNVILATLAAATLGALLEGRLKLAQET